jgi:hypothetical protein
MTSDKQLSDHPDRVMRNRGSLHELTTTLSILFRAAVPQAQKQKHLRTNHLRHFDKTTSTAQRSIAMRELTQAIFRLLL